MSPYISPPHGRPRGGLAFAGLLLACAIGGCSAEPVAEIRDAASPASSLVSIADDDWPWWRGPQRNGIASGPAPPTTWSETGNVLWKSPVPGRGHSSPTVVGDRIYLATADEREQTQSVVAFDRRTGQPLWTSEVHAGGLPQSGVHKHSTHANGTIACDGERLFIAFLNDGQIHATALDLEGKVLWQTALGAFQLDYGYAPSPMIYGGVVVVAADNPGAGYIAGLNRETGEIIWRKPRPTGTSYSTPVIVSVEGRDEMLLPGLGLISAYDPLTGSELWSCPGGTKAMVGAIVWDGARVFASGGYPGSETICVDAVTHQKVWENGVKAYEPSMLALGGQLYSFSQGGILYCWDAATGKERWKRRLGGGVSSSLTAHGDLLFATNEAGTTWVVRTHPAKYEEVAANQLGTEGFATPTICGGRIYIRTAQEEQGRRQESLYCIADSSSAPARTETGP